MDAKISAPFRVFCQKPLISFCTILRVLPLQELRIEHLLNTLNTWAFHILLGLDLQYMDYIGYRKQLIEGTICKRTRWARRKTRQIFASATHDSVCFLYGALHYSTQFRIDSFSSGAGSHHTDNTSVEKNNTVMATHKKQDRYAQHIHHTHTVHHGRHPSQHHCQHCKCAPLSSEHTATKRKSPVVQVNVCNCSCGCL